MTNVTRMSSINTLADLIRVHGAGRGEEKALIQAGRDSVTWKGLLDRSSRLAQALVDAARLQAASPA